ncbi:HNH endonuclease [Modestobacter sp. URMC 112]
MFEAGGFGVAVSPSLLMPADFPVEPLPPGVTRRPSRLTDVLDPAGFDDHGLAGELAAVGRARSQLAAYEAAVVAELASRRPATTDLTEDQPGHGVEGWGPDREPAGVSEFFADELAALARCSPAAATGLAERSLVLVHQLPTTWAALADGLIDLPRATALVRALGGQSIDAGGPVDPAVLAEVEAQALDWAVAGETPVRLAERTAARLIAVDDGAADRRRKRAERCADVTARATADGMGQLVGEMPMPAVAACRETLDRYARFAKADGDVRPIGQLRAQLLADLILRPWDTSREPVTAHLEVRAPLPTLTDRPAEGDARAAAPTDEDAASVDGAPITAGQLRALLEQLDALCPGGLQAPTGGRLDISLIDPHTGALRATVTRAELERLARRGCRDHPQDDCGCAVLDRPPPVDRYQPTPAQRRFVRARDRTCRHPGCRRPAARTDLDHVVAYADGGHTDCANLCCLCRRHHRLKTHAPGWSYRMTADGVLRVTTPSGVTRSTRPPGTDLPAEWSLAPVHPVPAGIAAPADDPPPF